MDKLVANNTVNALQSLFEAINVLAADLPPDRREKVDRLLRASQGARAAIMAEMM